MSEVAIEDGNDGNNYEVIRQSASGTILAATDNGGGGDGGTGGGGDGGTGGNGGNNGGGGTGDNGGGTGGSEDDGNGGAGGGGNDNPGDEDKLVRLLPAYLAALATKEPCRTADQRLDIRQRYLCPIMNDDPDQAAIEITPYTIEDGGLRLPERV